MRAAEWYAAMAPIMEELCWYVVVFKHPSSQMINNPAVKLHLRLCGGINALSQNSSRWLLSV